LVIVDVAFFKIRRKGVEKEAKKKKKKKKKNSDKDEIKRERKIKTSKPF
jgi:hypothetical protein